MIGSIQSVLDRGFGFITGEDGKRYFFHTSGVLGSFSDLRQGDQVSFDVLSPEPVKGPGAANVQLVAPEPAA